MQWGKEMRNHTKIEPALLKQIGEAQDHTAIEPTLLRQGKEVQDHIKGSQILSEQTREALEPAIIDQIRLEQTEEAQDPAVINLNLVLGGRIRISNLQKERNKESPAKLALKAAWLVVYWRVNQMNQTNQMNRTNQMDRTNQMMKWALASPGLRKRTLSSVVNWPESCLAAASRFSPYVQKLISVFTSQMIRLWIWVEYSRHMHQLHELHTHELLDSMPYLLHQGWFHGNLFNAHIAPWYIFLFDSIAALSPSWPPQTLCF